MRPDDKEEGRRYARYMGFLGLGFTGGAGLTNAFSIMAVQSLGILCLIIAAAGYYRFTGKVYKVKE